MIINHRPTFSTALTLNRTPGEVRSDTVRMAEQQKTLAGVCIRGELHEVRTLAELALVEEKCCE